MDILLRRKQLLAILVLLEARLMKTDIAFIARKAGSHTKLN